MCKPNTTHARIDADIKRELKSWGEPFHMKLPAVFKTLVSSPSVKNTFITNARLKSIMSNKRGQTDSITSIFIIIGMFFLLGLFFLCYYVFSILAPPLVGFISDGNNMMKDIASADSNLNQSYQTPYKLINNLTTATSGIAYVVFFIMLIGFLILAFNVSSHKYLIGVWFVFVIILTGIGIGLSSSYSNFTSGLMSDTYAQWGVNDYIMRYYPYLIGGFGFILGIVLFLIGFKPEDNSFQGGSL